MPQQQAPSPAEKYQQFFVPAIFGPWANGLVERAGLRAGDAVLDLACGTGIVARTAAPIVGRSGRVAALDLRPGMLDAARSTSAPEGPPIEWVEGDATDPDFPDESFDHVICQAGLQFFPDRVRALAEARRVLKPYGRLTLLVWQSIDRHPVYKAVAEAEFNRLGTLGVTWEEVMMPFSLGDATELASLMREAGLREIEIAPETREVRFPDPDRFVTNMEYAYAAVIPQFAADPVAFERFLAEVEEDTRSAIAPYRQGDWVVFPMHALIATAHA